MSSEKIYSDLTQLIGRTPLLKINKLTQGMNVEIIAKLESYNPGSSVKDRIGLAMIEAAEKSGELKKDGVIVEPTSGNTGIGLALVAAVKGYRIILVMPESMSIERRKMMQSYGAELVLTPAAKGMKGSIESAERISKSIPGGWMPMQFSNPANPAVHERTTGPEIWEDCGGKIDFLVGGVGTGGTISGAGRFLKTKNPALKVIAVEPIESAVLSGEAGGPHLIQGIGAGFVPANLHRDVVDEIEKISGPASIACAKKLTKLEGISAGISSGAAMACALRIAERPENKNKRIVVILPDTGERYISTLLFHED